MCLGAEYAWVPYAVAAATTAAGTATQINATRQRRQATEQVAAADLARKRKLNDEAGQLFESELQNSRVGDASADVDAEAAKQLAEAQTLVQRPQPVGYGAEAPQAGSSPVVREVAARQLSDALAQAEGQMKARAMLQGFQQRQIKRGTKFGRSAEQMQLLGNRSRGWDQVAETERMLAQNAGSKNAMLGDALVGLGSVAAAYAGGTAKPTVPTNYANYVPSVDTASPFYENAFDRGGMDFLIK